MLFNFALFCSASSLKLFFRLSDEERAHVRKRARSVSINALDRVKFPDKSTLHGSDEQPEGVS